MNIKQTSGLNHTPLFSRSSLPHLLFLHFAHLVAHTQLPAAAVLSTKFAEYAALLAAQGQLPASLRFLQLCMQADGGNQQQQQQVFIARGLFRKFRAPIMFSS